MRLAGRQFRVATLDIAAVAQIIDQATERFGFSVDKNSALDDAIEIRAVRTGSRHRVVFRGLLQRVEWCVAFDESRSAVRLTYNRKWFLWYKLLVLVLAIPVAFTWQYGFQSLFRLGDDLESVSLAPVFLPLVGFGAMVAYARLIVPVTDSIRYVDDLRRDFLRRGFDLESRPNEILDRVIVTHGAFLGYVGVATLPVLFDIDLSTVTVRSGLDLAIIAGICLLVVFLVVLLFALFIGARRFGADERFAAILSYIYSMIVLISFLGAQIGVHAYGKPETEYWKRAFRSQAVGTADATSELRASDALRPVVANHGIDNVARRLLFLPIGFLLVMWAVGLLYGYFGLRRAALALSICRRLGTDAHIASSRATISGGGFLGGFRTVYTAVWIICISLVLLGTIPLVGLAYSSLETEPTSAEAGESPGAVRGMINAVALLTNTDADSPFVIAGVRVFLVAWASLVPLLVVVSISDHVLRRLREHQRLRGGQSFLDGVGCDGPYAALLGELARNLDSGELELVVTDTPHPQARPHGGVLRRSRLLVEVSRSVIELLDPAELQAIVAHELAHHVCGHRWRHELLVWLGRLTLAGDTFVGALEDSFGFELEADAAAVSRFHIKPHVLRSALLKMQVATLVGTCDPESPSTTTDANAITAKNTAKTTFGAIRETMAAWLSLYRGEPPLSYWHPSLRDRLAKIDDNAAEAVTTEIEGDSTDGCRSQLDAPSTRDMPDARA